VGQSARQLNLEALGQGNRRQPVADEACRLDLSGQRRSDSRLAMLDQRGHSQVNLFGDAGAGGHIYFG
jgi:hypothetical protein